MKKKNLFFGEHNHNETKGKVFHLDTLTSYSEIMHL